VIKIADFYDEEVDIAIGNIQKMIEPIILVVMAVVI
jgi:type II secretory pathway component PulF